MAKDDSQYLPSHLASLEDENRALRELLSARTIQRDRCLLRLAALGQADLVNQIQAEGEGAMEPLRRTA
jgi:hypothetical protein